MKANENKEQDLNDEDDLKTQKKRQPQSNNLRNLKDRFSLT